MFERTELEDLTDAELLSACPYDIEDIDAAESLGKCNVIPHRREQEFLDYDGEEALYGGAVGGGKTEALLLWLAEGVQYDNFSGLFLVRTKPALIRSPTSPLHRSWKFFKQMGGSLAGETWTFPNGAQVTFDSMQHENDKHKFDGPEFHRVCVDQVEQFSETQYTYMFTRLRRVKGYPIPCGIRSSANPVGGHWVKQRFVSPEAIEALKQYTAYDATPPGMMFDCPGADAKFFPARIADNPSLEVEEYINRLRGRLSAALAAKMANGDWSAVEGAVIDAEDLRYYTTQGCMLKPIVQTSQPLVKDERACRRFATIDTAGTSKQKAAEARGRSPSWSVCAVWDHWPAVGLFLRDMWRGREGWPSLVGKIDAVLEKWGRPKALIENAHYGQALKAELKGNVSLGLLPTKWAGMTNRANGIVDGVKHDRAVASGFLRMVEDGQIYLPDVSTVEGAAGWMPEFESELLSWTGHPDETADQIDVCSHAAYHVRRKKRGTFTPPTNIRAKTRW